MSAKNSYANSAMIRRAVSAVQAAGLLVGSVRLHPDGTIELVGIDQPVPTPVNDFDRLEAAGCL